MNAGAPSRSAPGDHRPGGVPCPTKPPSPHSSAAGPRPSFEIVELTVTAGADVAFAHALLKCGTADELREHPERRLRLTIGLRKDDGRWVVTHEHHSFPITS